jgi:hypothetical protein
VVIVLVAVACGGHTPEPLKNTAGHGSAATAHAGSATVVATGSGSGIVPDVGCLAPSCAYHAGTATYFTCLAGGAGACFHFGGPCTPTDNCMYDAQARNYKQCSRAVEGTCAQWGASACAPASACMFDPDDSLHHHCEDIAGGACRKFGALCAP